MARVLVEARRALGAIDQLPLEIVGISRATVLAAAHIKARFPISYADAFAVVTARDHDGVVMTGDREFEPRATAGRSGFVDASEGAGPGLLEEKSLRGGDRSAVLTDLAEPENLYPRCKK